MTGTLQPVFFNMATRMPSARRDQVRTVEAEAAKDHIEEAGKKKDRMGVKKHEGGQEHAYAVAAYACSHAGEKATQMPLSSWTASVTMVLSAQTHHDVRGVADVQ